MKKIVKCGHLATSGNYIFADFITFMKLQILDQIVITNVSRLSTINSISVFVVSHNILKN